MKKFSKHWKSSSKPRKKRNYAKNAPLHMKKKLLSVHLSKELRQKYGKRNVPVRTGDKVKVLVGQFKKKEGKVEMVDYKNIKVKITGIEHTKMDGKKVPSLIHPSNLMITALNLDDKRRVESIERNIKKGEAAKTSPVQKKQGGKA